MTDTFTFEVPDTKFLYSVAGRNVIIFWHNVLFCLKILPVKTGHKQPIISLNLKLFILHTNQAHYSMFVAEHWNGM